MVILSSQGNRGTEPTVEEVVQQALESCARPGLPTVRDF